MPRRLRLPVVAACGLAAFAMLSARAQADVFDMDVHVYCDLPGFGNLHTYCGFDNEYDLTQAMFQRAQDMNMRFCPNGLTFRPNIDIEYGGDYPGILFEDPPSEVFIKELRDNVAAIKPTVEHMFVPQRLAGGFAAVPPVNPKLYPNEWYGVFAGTMIKGGGWAHEMGHHFSLAHSHTWDDPGTNRDQDGLACTNDDPGPEEDFVTTGNGPDDDVWAGALRPDHEYCTEVILFTSEQSSKKPDYCTASCIYRLGQGVPAPLFLTPPTWNAMAFYKERCHGPYTIPSGSFEAFCSQQTTLVLLALNSVPERTELVEICGASGDADCDGICQNQDNCKSTRNTAQINSDSDIYGDACDNCPGDTNQFQQDFDGDGVGDACDLNDDNDCCLDGVDDDPYDPTVYFGPRWGDLCPDSYSLRIDACDDSDGDGIPACRDPDDDNDGFGDYPQDLCPFDETNQDGTACASFIPCAAGHWADLCGFPGAGCLEFLLKIYDVIDPAPTTTFFDRFEIVNETLYLYRNAGMSLDDAANAVLGIFKNEGNEEEGGAGNGSAAAEWRIEIWKRDSNGDPVVLVAVVAESYDPTSVVVGDLTKGTLLALEPPGASPMTLAATWAVGLAPGVVPDDPDGDGVPSFFDVCSEVYDPAQLDRDGDLFGDACDADLDNDGWVDASDLQRVLACVGADLNSSAWPIFEGMDEPPGTLPPTVDEARAHVRGESCAPFDADGDGFVTDTDVAIVQAGFGQPPGPSGFIPTEVHGLPTAGRGLTLALLGAFFGATALARLRARPL